MSVRGWVCCFWQGLINNRDRDKGERGEGKQTWGGAMADEFDQRGALFGSLAQDPCGIHFGGCWSCRGKLLDFKNFGAAVVNFAGYGLAELVQSWGGGEFGLGYIGVNWAGFDR